MASSLSCCCSWSNACLVVGVMGSPPGVTQCGVKATRVVRSTTGSGVRLLLSLLTLLDVGSLLKYFSPIN